MKTAKHTLLLLLGTGLIGAAMASAIGAQRGPAGAQPQTQPLRTAIFDPQQKIYYADANDHTIRALPVRDNVWMIVGAGGNITVQTGEDGVLVVDTGSGGAATEKVQTILRALSANTGSTDARKA
jgi:glyoxylase-like metal-dependent hydrolase (beta-lactamase superfamily II)